MKSLVHLALASLAVGAVGTGTAHLNTDPSKSNLTPCGGDAVVAMIGQQGQGGQN